jgi:predicted amidohydrolase YtcJ
MGISDVLIRVTPPLYEPKRLDTSVHRHVEKSKMQTTRTSPDNPNTLRIYLARRIYTMDESLPQATAVGVVDGCIVAVGDMSSMEPWKKGREVVVDTSLRNKILMPGFIDNHVHPFLGALMTPMEIIAPEPWRMPGGHVCPAANTPGRYMELLKERLAAKPDKSEWFITFGFQPAEHGKLTRCELDALCPDRPIVLWQRSFHESYLNSVALERLGLTEETAGKHPQVDLAAGHFFETGNFLVMQRLMPYLLQPERYHRGLNITADLMQQGGITTAADMLFGALSPDYELAALDTCIEKPGRPLRVVNICDARGFAGRASGAKALPSPGEGMDFAGGLKLIEKFRTRESRRIRFSKAVKLFADGAIFSQLMQMNKPGFTDGHHGEWLMEPNVLADGVRVFWDADYQIHVHVNGDAGMDSVLAALSAAQSAKPRFDHRFMMHHVGFHTTAQSRRMAALGAHASVNSYYIHALADGFAVEGLGPERAAQIVRAGSMVRNGISVSFHSDFMMAPLEPLLLAWCAAARVTRSGRKVSPEECLTLDQALRGITIDAAYGLHMDHEIGSIVAGKKADFTVLEDDPFELGIERLKDVRVAGTVFEGELHLLHAPMASIFQSGTPQSYSHAFRAACCGDGDPCAFVQNFAGLMPGTKPLPRPNFVCN